MVGLMALLPQVVDAVAVPVIAAGGNRRSTRSGSGADTERECDTDRNRVPAISGSQDAFRLLREAGPY
jgi:hypothetical protein